MEKENIKKLILYISLIPYVYLIFSSLFFDAIVYSNGTAYGLDILLVNLLEFWFENFIMFNFIGFIYTCCFAYQTWYFITCSRKSSDNNNEVYNEKENTVVKKRKNIKEIIFKISCSIWIVYLLYGIYVAFFGYRIEIDHFTKETIYGLKAFIEAMQQNFYVLSYIPILPPSFIYIVMYSISNIRKKNK